jgi:hypothetical protein
VKPDWAGPIYLAMLGNRGVVDCYGTPPFEGQRARAVSDPLYRGEAYVEESAERSAIATARVTEWSPNHARIALDGAGPGSTVVYNMNFDDGWRSDAGTVIAVDGKVAVRLDEPRTSVTLWYRPRGLDLGLVLGALSVVASGLLCWRARRTRMAG